jgi:hypothetical protein
VAQPERRAEPLSLAARQQAWASLWQVLLAPRPVTSTDRAGGTTDSAGPTAGNQHTAIPGCDWDGQAKEVVGGPRTEYAV